jgi:transcriptional regulator with XRE-family HTH domain
MTGQTYETQVFTKASCDLDLSVSHVKTLNVDTTPTQQFLKRSRGIVISCEGLKRLQAAIVRAELKENYGKRFTQEELSDRMRVSTKTLSRLWSLTAGLDQRTLKLCFSAFDLQLTVNDYTTLESCADSSSDVKSHLPKPQLVDCRRYKYPSGPEALNSIFYIPRLPIEQLAYHEIAQPGCLIRIKAAKEMGKSSLLYRILAYCETLGYQTVNLDINQADASILSNLDKFLRWLCKNVSQKLNLESKLDDYWDEEMGSKSNCSIYFQAYLLQNLNSSLVLALNEIDKIFEYPEVTQEFLSLLRSWHESGKYEPLWQKLRLVVTYSTEIYIPLDINKSPCNVGLPIELGEFSLKEVRELALRHGLDWRFGDEAEQLMAMVGGHPYLVRIALYYLCCRGMTLSQLLLEASTESGIYGDHLLRKLNVLHKKKELQNAFESLLAADSSIPLQPILAYQLESMGLVKINSDGVTISRELYRNYFHKQLL